MHKRTFDQERRALARRGSVTERRAVRIAQCSATGEHRIKSGVRQPAVVGETHLQVRFRKVAGVW